MPLISRFTFAALALACTGAIPAGAALIMHKDLSLDIAKTLAEGAVAAIRYPRWSLIATATPSSPCMATKPRRIQWRMRGARPIPR